MFEGTAPQFWDSLSRLKAPPETAICCAHEYTASNARFALHADPDNGALRDYAAEIERLRADGRPTVPARLDRELATNPFPARRRSCRAGPLGRWRRGGDVRGATDREGHVPLTDGIQGAYRR
jgi:hydroxyacylglutathione hydrolase